MHVIETVCHIEAFAFNIRNVYPKLVKVLPDARSFSVNNEYLKSKNRKLYITHISIHQLKKIYLCCPY